MFLNGTSKRLIILRLKLGTWDYFHSWSIHFSFKYLCAFCDANFCCCLPIYLWGYNRVIHIEELVYPSCISYYQIITVKHFRATIITQINTNFESGFCTSDFSFFNLISYPTILHSIKFTIVVNRIKYKILRNCLYFQLIGCSII